MPTSIDPQPGENEIECANCGATIYYELTRCPHCGVNLYEPEDDLERSQPASLNAGRSTGLLARLGGFIRRITGRPYAVDELFGASLNQAGLYNDLLLKVGGDRAALERLVEFERQQMPQGSRTRWLESAIRRWERDNRRTGGGIGN